MSKPVPDKKQGAKDEVVAEFAKATQLPPRGKDLVQVFQDADSLGWMRRDTSTLQKTIYVDSIDENPTQVDSESGYELLGSYNWKVGAHATIYVPGAPPKWTRPSLPMTLPNDQGEFFIDQNTYRAPWATFEPMFQAVAIMRPDFMFDDVEVVTDRNSLRKLLGFVTGKLSKTFRIDLAMVHDTLIVTRKEPYLRETLKASRNNGYGHGFERHCTVLDTGLEDSTSYHRIIRYHLGNINCVVRYEVDARLDKDSSADKANEDRLQTGDMSENAAVAALQGLTISKSKEDDKTLQQTRVLRKGFQQESSLLVELKTRKKRPALTDIIPQLWFGRVSRLALGIHTDGTFENVTIEDTAAKFGDWEERCQSDLRKLAWLLQCFAETLKASGQKSCVAICNHKQKPLCLEIYGSTSKRSVLPRHIISRHWRITSRSKSQSTRSTKSGSQK